MAALYEVEATVHSATDLKNVNWRHGNLMPYAVVWVEPQTKCPTYADLSGGGVSSYHWDQKLFIPFSTLLANSTLHIDIMQAEAADDTAPLIGSAQIALRDVGFGAVAKLTLQLKRPSGRLQGEVEVSLNVRKLGNWKQASAGIFTESGDGTVACRMVKGRQYLR